jgi:hexosaminidase
MTERSFAARVVVVLVLCAVVAVSIVSATPATTPYPSIVPKPTKYTQGKKSTSIFQTSNNDVAVACDGDCPGSVRDIILRATHRLLAHIRTGVQTGVTIPYLRVRLAPIKNSSNPALNFPAISSPPLKMLKIQLNGAQEAVDAAKLVGLPEDYTLSVTETGAVVTASSFVGALRALQTFGQLVVYDGDQFVVPNLPVTVEDSPRFKHRGVLLDTARHFFPLKDILRVLEAMAMAKLNVLHWHIVDAQSFPFESKAFPELSERGAFDPTLVYKQSEVKDVVKYALDLGIRVVPEFDIPGHTASWGFSDRLEWVTTPCWGAVSASSGGVLERAINIVSMDVTQPQIFNFVNTLLDEVIGLFPDPYLHLGGDEVIAKCWNESASVREFMKKENISNLQRWFTKKVLKHVGARKTVILWEEAYESGSMDDDSALVVNIWKDLTHLQNASKTHPVLLSYGAYMDRALPVDGQPAPWMYVSTWTDMYLHAYPETLPSSVFGGELSSWDENADRTNIDTRLFQRGNAVAERLWSSSSVVDTIDARVRLAEFRCKQNRRIGTTVGPLFPDYCDVYGAQQHSPPGTPIATHTNYGVGWVVTAVCFIFISLVLLFFVFCRMAPQESYPEGARAGSVGSRSDSRTHKDFNYLALHGSRPSADPFDDIDGDIL